MAQRNCMYETTFVSAMAEDHCLAESPPAQHAGQPPPPPPPPPQSSPALRANTIGSTASLRKSLSLSSLACPGPDAGAVAAASGFSSDSSVESLRTFSSYENVSVSASASPAASCSTSRPSSISSLGSDSHTYRAKSRSRQFFKSFLRFSKKKIVYMLSPISDKSYPDISAALDGRASGAANQKSIDGRNCDRDAGDDGTAAGGSSSNSNEDQKRCEIDKFDLLKKIDLQIDFDSGISIQSSNASDSVPIDSFEDLPFDMPKLTKRIKSIAQQKKADEPFAFKVPRPVPVPASLSLQLPLPGGSSRSIRTNLSLAGLSADEPVASTAIDAHLPLNYQNWYHGLIDRHESENQLRGRKEGSFLVRSRPSASRSGYILSIKSALGYFHVRIKGGSESRYSLTSGSAKATFASVPELIRHYSLNRLTCVKGAEHLLLSCPIEVRLL